MLSDGSSTYLYGLDRIAQKNVVGWQYYQPDALGSVRQVVNAAGTVIQARNYEPFGKQLSAAGNPLTKYAFTGEWQDPTGQIYLRARYYDPATGRFLSKDPFRGIILIPLTLNPYPYALDNPLNILDPTGKRGTCLDCGPGNLEPTPPNPQIGTLVLVGIPITIGIYLTEVGLAWIESHLAPIAGSSPVIGVPLELLFIFAGIFLIDVDVAYWIYTYRVYQDPCTKQYLELIPPWGLE